MSPVLVWGYLPGLEITIDFVLYLYTIDHVSFLPVHARRVQAGTESQKSVYIWWVVSAVISSSSSSPSSVEEGSSQTCVGAVPRDLSLYDIMSGIR